MRMLKINMYNRFNNFLNGYSLDNKSIFFYPLLDRNKFYLERDFIKELKQNRKKLNNFYYRLKLLSNNFKNKNLIVSSKTFLELIKIFYLDISKLRKNSRKKLRNVCPKKQKDWENQIRKLEIQKDKKILYLKKFINEIKKELFIKDIIIQGSLSTLDYTDWSDFDIVLVLNKDLIFENHKEILKIRKRIIKLNKYFFLNDPLQHHGFFIFSRMHFNDYYEEYMPTIIFKYGVSIFSEKYSFKINEFKKDYYILWLSNTIDDCKKKLSKPQLNNYKFKSLLHSLLLIPSFFLESNNVFLYKKYSFTEINKYLDQKKLNIIKNLTKIRNDLNFNPKWQKILRFYPNYNIYRIVNYFSHTLEKSYNLNRIEAKTFLSSLERKLK